jgi:2Fe-2S ferredoxin
MPTVTFLQQDGTAQKVDAAPGTSLMRAAVANDVPGILAECGGQAMCATCHVYIDPADADQLPPVTDDEDEMLDVTEAERRPTSRLSCQVALDDTLDGLTAHVPETQQ